MVDEKLSAYVDDCIKKGASPFQIRLKLKNSQFKEKEISAAFREHVRNEKNILLSLGFIHALLFIALILYGLALYYLIIVFPLTFVILYILKKRIMAKLNEPKKGFLKTFLYSP